MNKILKTELYFGENFNLKDDVKEFLDDLIYNNKDFYDLSINLLKNHCVDYNVYFIPFFKDTNFELVFYTAFKLVDNKSIYEYYEVKFFCKFNLLLEFEPDYRFGEKYLSNNSEFDFFYVIKMPIDYLVEINLNKFNYIKTENLIKLLSIPPQEFNF